MKLNYKRSILVGMAFLSICAFWQLYDNVVPLILKNTFNLPDDIAGVIMAMDNVLALFLLPLFGKLSDGKSTKLGKRTPFIIGGTAAAVVLMNLLPWADKTAKFTPFIIILGLLLIAMCTYRSPAVALMPDVTPKPLRSKANAIINLMGAIGGVFTLGATSFLVSKGADGREDYTLLFLAVSLLMAFAVVLLVLTVRERKLAKEVADAEALEDAEAAKRAQELEGAQPAEIAQTAEAHSADISANNASADAKASKRSKSLSPELRRSLMLILFSVFFWYMGYNAVTTAFTKYVNVQWGYDIKAAAQCLMIATVGAVLIYIPAGAIASRFGRKRVIQLGVIILAACFAVASFFKTFNVGVYVVFALVGAAWAMINVNSYPMAVEISKSSDVGKYTGYYYTFSMAAQIITPIVSGWLLEHVGYGTLLPYAATMVAISFVTISLTKHGDSKPTPPKSKLEAFDAGDD